jgi:hypothetical protein
MFCKHEWKVLSATATKSKFEHSMEIMGKVGKASEFELPGHLCCAERKHIQVFTCDKCGKLKRFVETI